MHHVHPDTVRPDLGGFHMPTGPSFPGDESIADRLATVIKRQAREGSATLDINFADEPETRELRPGQITANIGRARQIADRTVIRQDDFETAQRELANELQQRPLVSDDKLVAMAVDLCAGLLPNEADMIGQLRKANFEISTIDRLWTRIVDGLGDHFAATRAPYRVGNPVQAAVTGRKAVG